MKAKDFTAVIKDYDGDVMLLVTTTAKGTVSALKKVHAWYRTYLNDQHDFEPDEVEEVLDLHIIEIVDGLPTRIP